jgi:phospholipid/cholesterol/gamma-HCH transport system substrate-binding protein
MTQRAQQILQNLETATRTLSEPELQQDLRGSLHSVNLILKQAAEGGGYLHRFLADPAEGERVSRLVASTDRAASELEQTLAEARKAFARVNEGPGFAHDVFYGERGSEALANFGGAAGEVAATLKGIREGNGLAHAMLYGGPEGGGANRVADNLGAMTDDLRQIVADMRAGKGTIGALLVDPSIYEDAKRVLGNVERNDALRALVRYSIKQDEKRPEVGAPAPAGGSKPAAAR